MKIYKTENAHATMVVCARTKEEAIVMFKGDEALKYDDNQDIEESDFDIDEE